MKQRGEIKCAYQEVVISRSDTQGNIIYCNSTFVRINGLKGASAIHRPERDFYHPDTPQTILEIIQKTLQSGFPIQAIIKNQTRDHKYYWSMVEYKPQKDQSNQLISYVAYGKQAPEQIIEIMEPLYKMMREIEELHGTQSALVYLHGYLDEQKMTYSQYLHHLTKNRGFKCLCEFIRHSIFKSQK